MVLTNKQTDASENVQRSSLRYTTLGEDNVTPSIGLSAVCSGENLLRQCGQTYIDRLDRSAKKYWTVGLLCSEHATPATD